MENKKQNKPKVRFKKSVKVAFGVITIFIGIGAIKEYKKNNEFIRVINEEGNYELDGFINYDNLKEYSVVQIVTSFGEKRLYIAKGEKYQEKRIEHHRYKDIYSNEIIGIDTSLFINDTVTSVSNINDFLIAYDMIKGKYSEEDIDYLLDKIEEDYERYETEKAKYKIYQ